MPLNWVVTMVAEMSVRMSTGVGCPCRSSCGLISSCAVDPVCRDSGSRWNQVERMSCAFLYIFLYNMERVYHSEYWLKTTRSAKPLWSRTRFLV